MKKGGPRTGLMWVARLPPGTRVMSGPGWLPQPYLGLQQPGSMLISMIQVATKATGIPGVWAKGHSSVGAMIIRMACADTQGNGNI